MKTKNLLLISICCILFSACKGDEIVDAINLTKGRIETKAAYDNGYFEWDNVLSFTYKLSSDVIKDDLSIPWEPGSANAVGIPKDWVDDNLRNSDPKQRAYSKDNGWELVYSNLFDKAQRNKYFALYNKYTGILRMFYYSFEASSGYGTSCTFVGLQVTESSSMLNFSFDYPLPMDQRQNSPSTIFSPKCSFTKTTGSQNEAPVQGIGYKSNTWYAMEVECAYDAASQNSNRLMTKLWAANISAGSIYGTSSGSITGNILTTYSNVPGFNLNLSVNNSKTSNLQTTYNESRDQLAEKVENGVNTNDSFFKGIWNNLKKDVPSIVSKGIKEGIGAIFTSGGSLATKAIGKLAGSIFGGGSAAPMQSTGKVDLGITTDIKLTSETVQNVVGWGDTNPFPLPGSGFSTTLYDEKLGVWNLVSAPIVYVDMNTRAYFYPWDLAPNQQAPRLFDFGFDYHLSPATISINPVLLLKFTLQNQKQELVYTHGYDIIEGEPYGLMGNLRLYKGISTSQFSTQKPIEDFGGNYNPKTSFENCWHWGIMFAKRDILCRVSFDLVPKGGGDTYSFSKYFFTNLVKRNHSHKDAIVPGG